jgi:xanthine dehydrogenase YagT iron-sulfur-binding subunit
MIPPMAILHLDVNGGRCRIEIDDHDAGATLLDALRDGAGLVGTKRGCEVGACGACTVLVDGRRVNACLVLAAAAQGCAITTIEGVARGDELHPIQREFAERDALQCGYCTPGQIVSALAYLAEGHANAGDPATISEWMSGNLCRCGAYPGIVAAIAAVAAGGAR